MEKIYYNRDGWVCNRNPNNFPIESEDLSLEVNDDVYNSTLSCGQGMAWRVVNGNLELQVYNSEEFDMVNNTVELNNLKEWFNGYYTIHEQKYRRLIDLGQLTDDNKRPEDELWKLYNRAETNRRRIKELEILLNFDK